jgi:hypothetical protein
VRQNSQELLLRAARGLSIAFRALPLDFCQFALGDVRPDTDELSRMVWAGWSRPSSRALRTMRSTGRSFSESPGLRHSILANTSTSGNSSRNRGAGTSGVWPRRATPGSAPATVRSGDPRAWPSHGRTPAAPAARRRGCEISLGSLFIQQRPSRCLRRQHAVVPVPNGFGLDRGFFTDFCSA